MTLWSSGLTNLSGGGAGEAGTYWRRWRAGARDLFFQKRAKEGNRSWLWGKRYAVGMGWIGIFLVLSSMVRVGLVYGLYWRYYLS